MPRRAYPNQLHDHLGQLVRLSAKPFAIGGEGAVFDVQGRPQQVAKLYSTPPGAERCDKLRAMVKLCNPDLLKIAAWPTATLSTRSPAEVEGILMPRISDYKEIHHLYSVAQRKKDFPEVDWGFLLHTARNCASAFEKVHSHGHVIGDVNQKNVMVSRKGTVAIVDCDSFQVKEENHIFRCTVGVPEYTPPELHGTRFSDVDRNANHDAFGLAVIIFHLLMMGRHPFSGVPQGNLDVPIERAIQEYLFAYSRTATKLMPPPRVPPVKMLGEPIRDLFEQAFRAMRRPTASEWLEVLDTSLKQLQRCGNDRKHSYPAAAGSCPWCRLIATERLMFFIPSQDAAGSALQIDRIRDLINRLNGMTLVFSTYSQPKPLLPIHVNLPSELRRIPKPDLLSHPASPEPVPSPFLESLPPQPTYFAKPKLYPLPSPPLLPQSPTKAYPPAPAVLPKPALEVIPERPSYPTMPTDDPLDPFLTWFSFIWMLLGVPVCFIAKPVGVVVICGFGAWWLTLLITSGYRRRAAEESIRESLQEERRLIDEEYRRSILPLLETNARLLDSWEAANEANNARHYRQCRIIDEDNSRSVALWRAEISSIEEEHQRIVRAVEQQNQCLLLDWETKNRILQKSYDEACQKVNRENERRTADWHALIGERRSEYEAKCRSVDQENKRRLADWDTANAPWFAKGRSWQNKATAAKSRIQHLENELIARRSSAGGSFQQRLERSHVHRQSIESTLREYEGELQIAEQNSKKIQLDMHLEKSLIRNARLRGFNVDRLLSLESFGIETAGDVDVLRHQKVPGIGPVLSSRLFEWHAKLASSFKPQHSLPESERSRIAMRYSPVLLPVVQTLESEIRDIDEIITSHRHYEVRQLNAIASAVQDFAVASAYVAALQ